MIKTRVVRRIRRSVVRCWNCHQPIRPGEIYLVHTSFPGAGDDAGYASYAGHPVRMTECADCATRYGRGALIPERAS